MRAHAMLHGFTHVTRSRQLEGAASKAAADLGVLPEWNLSDLYAGPDAPEVARDLEAAAAQARRIKETYQGKLAELAARRRRPRPTPSRPTSGSRISWASSARTPGSTMPPTSPTRRAKFYGDISEKLTAISTDLIFFELELNQIDDAALAQALDEPARRPLQAVDRRPAQGEALPARGEDRAAVPREGPDRGAAPGTGCSARPCRRCASPSRARPSPCRSSRP